MKLNKIKKQFVIDKDKNIKQKNKKKYVLKSKKSLKQLAVQ